MLKQVLEIFKAQYEEYGDALILDTYIPKDGTYLIVDRNENGFAVQEAVEIKINKERVIDRTNLNMPFLCMADYHSSLIDMNKPIDKSKIIHSNNFYSFFVKKPSLMSEPGQPAAKLTKEVIHNYYEVLRNPITKYDNSKKGRLIYQQLEDKIGPPQGERIDEIEEWILTHIEGIKEQYPGKDYLKIFFRYGTEEADWKQMYQLEGERYFVPNIYNSNDSNVVIQGQIYGLPNDNMGFNAKKPFLENKTRKNTTPYLVSSEEVLLQKKLFDYLMNQAAAGKTNIYIDEDYGIRALRYNEMLSAVDEAEFSGIYFRIKKGKEVEIHDMDVISAYRPNLLKALNFENTLNVETEKLKREYGQFLTLWEIQTLIDDVLFGKTLVTNYFNEPKDISIKNQVLYNNLLISRQALFDWLYKGKGDANYVWGILDKVSFRLIRNSIQNDFNMRAINQFNLRIALQHYFEGGNSMAEHFYETYQDLKGKISQKEYSQISSDKEYFFAVGQLISFFLSRSKSKKKSLSLGNPIINAKRDDIIKKRLNALFKKYNYDLESYDIKFKNLYAMVLKYIPEGRVDSSTIIAGYVDRNMIYEKSGKSEEEK